jgi:hypothetical protein
MDRHAISQIPWRSKLPEKAARVRVSWDAGTAGVVVFLHPSFMGAEAALSV